MWTGAGLALAVVWSACLAADDWWTHAVFYQVYPKSFLDTTGSGSGDLQGIIKKLDYLKDLGVGGIWMNPIYKSPMKDEGYDVSDFRSVDPLFGNMTDLKELIKAVHDKGMKILMDFVPNHSSNEHPWFKESVKGNSTYKDYYVWIDASEAKNNWLSVMGGSAWEYNANRNQYYYHAFLKEQPDLNYYNDKVLQEMQEVMKFWLDVGADGFRVDAVPYLAENQQLLNDEQIIGCNDPNNYACFNHINTQNQNQTFTVLSKFLETINDFSKKKDNQTRIMIVEAYVDNTQLPNYFSFNNLATSTMPFNFGLQYTSMTTDAKNLQSTIKNWYSAIPKGAPTNWVLGNHDQNRIASKVGVPLSDGMNMLALLLPGATFSYYGEELAMTDTFVRCSQVQDTQAKRGKSCDKDAAVIEAATRDLERTPMQWDDSQFAGFSNVNPWLPVNPNYFQVNTKSEGANSHLSLYKALVNLKKEMKDTKHLDTAAVSDWVFSFRRYTINQTNSEYIVVINLNNQYETVNLTSLYKNQLATNIVRAASINSDKKVNDKVDLGKLALRPKEAVVLSNQGGSSGSSALSFSFSFLVLAALASLSSV